LDAGGEELVPPQIMHFAFNAAFTADYPTQQ
jgi:hypothetical protein